MSETFHVLGKPCCTSGSLLKILIKPVEGSLSPSTVPGINDSTSEGVSL